MGPCVIRAAMATTPKRLGEEPLRGAPAKRAARTTCGECTRCIKDTFAVESLILARRHKLEVERRLAALEAELRASKQLTERLLARVNALEQERSPRPAAPAQAGPLVGIVTLKLGSRKFPTTAGTLASVPDSFFGIMASGRVGQRRERDGSIFIDRNPKHFQFVLDYLRCNGEGFVPPTTKRAQDELRGEAEFYGLEGLARALRRFSVSASHLMTFETHKNGTFLRGNRFAACVFDVVDTNNFEVTFDFSASADLSSRCGSGAYFVGVAPALRVDIEGEWPMAIPEGPPRGASRPRHVRDLDRPSHNKTPVRYPPAVSQGVFLSSFALYLGPHRCQCVQFCKADMRACEASFWSPPGDDPREVRVHFRRTADGCTATFYTEEGGERNIDLGSEGLDTEVEYNPMVFFNTDGMVAAIDGLKLK